MTDEPFQTPSPDGADPSMEEILASIRRILNDDDVPAEAAVRTPVPVAQVEAEDEVLILDEAMLVAAPPASPVHAAPSAEPEPPAEPIPYRAPDPIVAAPQPQEAAPAPVAPPYVAPSPVLPAYPAADPATSDLLGAEAAAAAGASVGSLVRTLAGRTTQVYGGGPTLDDIVRAELRPLLKDWLDAYLPPMVERLVRAEIERVVGRYVP
jgi:cell pole-organizing protein PopZ